MLDIVTIAELQQMEKKLKEKLSKIQKEDKVYEVNVDQCEIINKILNYMEKHMNIGSSVPLSTFPLTTMNITAEFQPEIFPLYSSEEEIESSISEDETTSTDSQQSYIVEYFPSKKTVDKIGKIINHTPLSLVKSSDKSIGILNNEHHTQSNQESTTKSSAQIKFVSFLSPSENQLR
ncbi:unnamed protein product [Rotaria sordida]|uniref:Uncharacterized protein n=1 Tax=Rotaria sordida TaxID=392033 RepID=A0A815PS74_9BILA|nr:unnamed protein product [Rotaria sordida]CAF1452791.1 unnamed protein product [Rotaria sordida]CAF3700850.1 unnamed protein product [Rotaria sordida]CAF3940086.1 unnamed protein product [Rotaria sordida]